MSNPRLDRETGAAAITALLNPNLLSLLSLGSHLATGQGFTQNIPGSLGTNVRSFQSQYMPQTMGEVILNMVLGPQTPNLAGALPGQQVATINPANASYQVGVPIGPNVNIRGNVGGGQDTISEALENLRDRAGGTASSAIDAIKQAFTNQPSAPVFGQTGVGTERSGKVLGYGGFRDPTQYGAREMRVGQLRNGGAVSQVDIFS